MNEIVSNYTSVFKKFTVLTGRAGRREFWLFFLANFVVSIVLSIIDQVIGFGVLGLLYTLAVILPGLAVAIRRLHDTDRSGWWILVGLIPLVGWIVALVLMALEGTPGENRFGPPPSTTQVSVT